MKQFKLLKSKINDNSGYLTMAIYNDTQTGNMLSIIYTSQNKDSNAFINTYLSHIVETFYSQLELD